MTFLRTALPLLAALAIPALAQAQEAPRPELLNRLTDCRAMTDPAARLSCYDTAVEALDAAERQGEVVVVDRAQASTCAEAGCPGSSPSGRLLTISVTPRSFARTTSSA